MRNAIAKPGNAVTISSYRELQQHAEAFAKGYFGLLILLGRFGLGKSRALRDAATPETCWVEGNASPFGIYCELWEHRDQPVVLDDADGLYADPRGVRLLKSLCQTDPVKTVNWISRAAVLEREDIPRRFTTTSRVAIIANCWKTLSHHVLALGDRAHVVSFEPDAAEVHRQVAVWYWDQEIFDFVADHLHLLTEPSMRHYVVAWEKKQARLDWRDFILNCCLSGPTKVVARLQADLSYPTEEARAQAFQEAGAGCRATYFNHARRLRPPVDPPRLVLTSPPPEREVSNSQLALTLRWPRQQVGNR